MTSKRRLRSGALVLLVALASAASASPASARRTTRRFSVEATPAPALTPAGSEGACDAGEHGVNKGLYEFRAPADGRLRVDLSFTGDWDLSIRRPDGRELAQSTNDQVTGSAPSEESVLVNVHRHQTVHVVSCNWLGGPRAEGRVVFTPGGSVTSLGRP